jgi:hypothetical protein
LWGGREQLGDPSSPNNCHAHVGHKRSMIQYLYPIMVTKRVVLLWYPETCMPILFVEKEQTICGLKKDTRRYEGTKQYMPMGMFAKKNEHCAKTQVIKGIPFLAVAFL